MDTDCDCGCGECESCHPACGSGDIKCPDGQCLGQTNFYDVNEHLWADKP